MSNKQGEIQEVVRTSNQLFTNYDTRKIFIWNNSYQKGMLSNGSGASVDFQAGTLLGRVSANGNLVALASGATDGSNLPVGILAQDITIADGATAEVQYCVSGEVDQNEFIFDGTDTLDTVVTGKRLVDRIASDTAGIILRTADNLTEFDNS